MELFVQRSDSRGILQSSFFILQNKIEHLRGAKRIFWKNPVQCLNRGHSAIQLISAYQNYNLYLANLSCNTWRHDNILDLELSHSSSSEHACKPLASTILKLKYFWYSILQKMSNSWKWKLQLSLQLIPKIIKHKTDDNHYDFLSGFSQSPLF